MSFISTAYAMGAGQPAPGGEANIFASLMPFILIFAVFYFMLIRPQQKKAKEQKAMVEALKKGDHVLTNGGMYGRIVEVNGDVMLVDLGETKVTMLRAYLIAAPEVKQTAQPVKKEAKKSGRDSAKKTSAKASGVAENSVEDPADNTSQLSAPVADLIDSTDNKDGNDKGAA
ncbi:hypothetical protein FACS1894206_06580 [Deltaproteobacteria bacterium]|nr:hypothetical protein FACS1894206_06580 [Deltaproteobacteria bacterium]